MKIQKIHIADSKLISPNLGLLIGFCITLYVLAIFKDYVFSRIQFTGFYWSDTMLYNIYWLLFIPFIKLANAVYNKARLKSQKSKILYSLCTGCAFSIAHILIFTSIFILLSTIIYTTPHRFLTILKNAVSNQLHITVIAYLFTPLLFEYLKRKADNSVQETLKTITVKNGTKRTKIDVATILYIKTDRPYTMLHTTRQKYLHDENLKQLEQVLDAHIFLRVHRSVIINKNRVVELKSRKNGDYDGVLANGIAVRFSRHYRQNWEALLNH